MGKAASINTQSFKKISTPSQAYWLGFLYADGALALDEKTFELGLQLGDLEHLEKFKTFLKFDGKIYTDSYRCRLMFRNRVIGNDLIALGCTPRKSKTLMFPSNKQVPKKLQRHFIRGYLDGDGSIGKRGDNQPMLQLIGTKPFLEELFNIVPTIDKHPSLHQRTNQVTFTSGICCTKALLTMEWLYEDCEDFLERKMIRFLALKKQYYDKKIRRKQNNHGISQR